MKELFVTLFTILFYLISSAVVAESKKEKGSGDELQQYLEDRSRQIKEELVKRTQISVAKPFSFF